MGLKADLEKEVSTIFKSQWTTRDGQVVPEDKDVGLGNDAVKLAATVLYADLADSTKMVDKKTAAYSAEVYKTFLLCAAKIIKNQSGVVTAYDGDRVMAVYIGDSKNGNAVRTALQLRWARDEILNPAKNSQYPNYSGEPVNFVVGIDTSTLFVARTGVRGANDLVWVGRAANYAAKLAALQSTHVYITAEVYNNLHQSLKTTDGKAMWEAVTWNTFDNRTIYRSNWRTSIL